MSLATTLPVLFAGTGCYQYSTADPGALRPGQLVHVTLSSAGAVALGPAIGANASALDGRVTMAAGDSITVAVTQVTRIAGPEEFMQNEPVTLPRASAAAVTVRSLDAVRSAIAVAVVVVAAVVAQRATSGTSSASIKGGPSGQPK